MSSEKIANVGHSTKFRCDANLLHYNNVLTPYSISIDVSAGPTTWRAHSWGCDAMNRRVQLELIACDEDETLRLPVYAEFAVRELGSTKSGSRMFNIGDKTEVNNIFMGGPDNYVTYIKINITVFCAKEPWHKRQMCLPAVKTPNIQALKHIAPFTFRDEFSDVKVRVGNVVIPAHKIVLALSPVFYKMMEGSEITEIHLQDIEYETIVEVLSFIYTGKSDYLSKCPEKLLVAADRYQIGTLLELCEKALLPNLNVENACEMLMKAVLHNADNLRLGAKTFIIFHFHDVEKTEGFKKLRDTHIYLVVEIMSAMYESFQLSRLKE